MSTINLIIKAATTAEAMEAARKRQIAFTPIRELPKYSEVVGTCPDVQETKVRSWFVEPDGRSAPYPVGTLLHWSAPEHRMVAS
jgi:hypothetical protein